MAARKKGLLAMNYCVDVGLVDGRFPLTLTLSLGEREKTVSFAFAVKRWSDSPVRVRCSSHGTTRWEYRSLLCLDFGKLRSYNTTVTIYSIAHVSSGRGVSGYE